MKQVIMVLMVMLLFSSCSVTRHELRYSKGYIPLKKFKGDTVTYVLRNFHDHKERYVGKKLEVFFNDLEMPIGTNLYVPEQDFFTRKIAISPIEREEFGERMDRNEKMPLIYIEFNEPIPWPTLREVSSKEQGRWSNVSRAFFGKLTMKDINLISYLKAEKEVKGSQKVQKSRSPKSQ